MSEMASEATRAEAAELLQLLAGHRPSSVKRAIERAAARLGWSYSRTKDVWYLAARRIDGHELERLRALAGVAQQEQATRNELANLKARLDRLEKRLALELGPDLHMDGQMVRRPR